MNLFICPIVTTCENGNNIRLDKYIEFVDLGDRGKIYKLTKKGEKKIKKIAEYVKLICIENPSYYGNLLDYKVFKNLETIIYCGNDSDVKFTKLDSTLLQLKTLKTIYLQYVDLNYNIEKQVIKFRPDIKIIRTKPFVDNPFDPSDFCDVKK
ncbi:MAG: hypothetical protein RIR01_334 [Bacteroidota bacterium]